MIFDHTLTSINLQQKSSAIYLFFASQRNYGYVLAQENRYIARAFSLRILTEAKA